MNHSTLDEARAAKAKVIAAFAYDPSVNGIGITWVDEGYAVKLNLKTPPTAESLFPDQIDGGPIKVDVVGDIRKA
jgi:hypothetical protein